MDQNIVNAIGAVLIALLTLAGSLITRIAYLSILQLEAKFTAEQWALAKAFIIESIQWAEQYGILGVIENTGEAKKKAVLSAIQAYFDAHNIKLNAEQIDILIEAAIKRGVSDKSPTLTTSTISNTVAIAPSDATTTVTTS